MTILKFIPEYFEEKDLPSVAGFVRWISKAFAITNLCVLVGGTIFFFILFYLNKRHLLSINESHPIIYVCWLLPFSSAIVLLSQLLRGFNSFWRSTFYSQVLPYVGYITISYLLFFIVHQLNPQYILLSIALSNLILIGIIIFSLHSLLPHSLLNTPPQFQQKTWLKISLQFMVGSFVYSGLSALDLVMLEIFGHHENQVGYFSVILLIMGFITIADATVRVIYNPRINAYLANGELLLLQQFTHRINVLRFIILLPTVFVCVTFGKTILTSFGPSYVAAYDPLLVALIGPTLTASFGACSSLLQYSGHHFSQMIMNLINIIVVVILDAFIIPKYELMGAAVVYTLCCTGLVFAKMIYWRSVSSLRTCFII